MGIIPQAVRFLFIHNSDFSTKFKVNKPFLGNISLLLCLPFTHIFNSCIIIRDERGCSSGVERLLAKEKAGGSNPLTRSM